MILLIVDILFLINNRSINIKANLNTILLDFRFFFPTPNRLSIKVLQQSIIAQYFIIHVPDYNNKYIITYICKKIKIIILFS